MLTRKHLVQAAQLMHDYGELHAGALDHDASALVGPSSEPYVPLRARGGRDVEAACTSAVAVAYDDATGRLTFTRR